jgi:glycine hydroxymethyltransferase
VPNDPQSPFVTSGLRIGSPAITTRGFNAEDSSQLAHWICDVLESIAKDENDTSVIEEVRGKVTEICQRLPVYK